LPQKNSRLRASELRKRKRRKRRRKRKRKRKRKWKWRRKWKRKWKQQRNQRLLLHWPRELRRRPHLRNQCRLLCE
jgi:hypothetical protein